MDPPRQLSHGVTDFLMGSTKHALVRNVNLFAKIYALSLVLIILDLQKSKFSSFVKDSEQKRNAPFLQQPSPMTHNAIAKGVKLVEIFIGNFFIRFELLSLS